MRGFEKTGYIRVGIDELDLNKTLVRGQTFGWQYDKEQSVWARPLLGRMVALRQHDSFIEINQPELAEDISNYLDIQLEYNKIIQKSNDKGFIDKVIEYGRGIHILRQSFYETAVVFILSSCNTMIRIENLRERMCRTYGKEVEADGYSGYTFPSVDEIYNGGIDKIDSMGMGFRADYIKYALEIFKKYGEERFKELSDGQLYEVLLRLPGVGPKIASCIMLFGDHRLDMFPVDTHISKIIEREMNGIYNKCKYKPYNGIIQQYMFYFDTNKGEQI
jgi:hypothetical protein